MKFVFEPRPSSATAAGSTAQQSSAVQTPARKLKPVTGLISLTKSSSNKKNVFHRKSHQLFNNAASSKNDLKFGSNNNSSNNCFNFQIQKSHPTFDIELDYGFIKSEIFSKFVINIFQYLLYDCEVIPMPFQYFEKLYPTLNSSDCSTLNLAGHEMFQNLYSLFDFLAQIISNSQFASKLTEIALCLGESVYFAREIFILNLEEVNLIGHEDSKPHQHLSLRYLINTFYKKILNEINNSSESSKSTSSSKHSRKRKGTTASVIVAIRVREENLPNLENILEEYLKAKKPDNAETKFKFNLSVNYRLGSRISSRSTFHFRQLKELLKSELIKFEIFNESTGSGQENVKEEQNSELYEEVIFEEEFSEPESGTETEDDELEQSSEDSDLDKFLEESIRVSATPDQASPKEESDFVWIQLATPIKCFSKF